MEKDQLVPVNRIACYSLDWYNNSHRVSCWNTKHQFTQEEYYKKVLGFSYSYELLNGYYRSQNVSNRIIWCTYTKSNPQNKCYSNICWNSKIIINSLLTVLLVTSNSYSGSKSFISVEFTFLVLYINPSYPGHNSYFFLTIEGALSPHPVDVELDQYWRNFLPHLWSTDSSFCAKNPNQKGVDNGCIMCLRLCIIGTITAFPKAEARERLMTCLCLGRKCFFRSSKCF